MEILVNDWRTLEMLKQLRIKYVVVNESFVPYESLDLIIRILEKFLGQPVVYTEDRIKVFKVY
jgi:hypothetical protein